MDDMKKILDLIEFTYDERKLELIKSFADGGETG